MTYLKIWKNFAKLISGILIVCPQVAISLTLQDAIILSHENNYKILSEYQNLSASKMSKPQAYSGLLPSIKLNHTNIHNTYNDALSRNYYGSPYYYQNGITIDQPIFNGGATYAQIKIADKMVKSGLANFDNVSNFITVQTVQAYEGVLAYREIFRINIKNLEVFEKNLEYSKIRFDAGVVTRTDVLQTEVRLSQAKAQKEKAYADMRNSEANFEHIIGIVPQDNIEQIDIAAIVLPEDIDKLIQVAKDNNPGLQIAKEQAKIAKYQINLAASQILPTVSANAQFTKSSQSKLSNYSTPGTAGGNTYLFQVQIPIFQGGGEYAKIAEKKYLANKSNLDYLEAERQLIEDSIAVWNNYRSIKTVIAARQDAIDAAEQALDGVKEEVNAGTRTTLDLLNAEKELFDARVGLRSANYDYVVSIYQMLQVMGQLDTPTLKNVSEVKSN